MKRICSAALLTLGLTVALVPTVQAQTPQETLNQYISDLRNNPNDYALREKILRHVQTMRPAPAIPEEAERYMARGSAAVKGAKNERDFQDASQEFEKASLAAPWLAAAYYNLSITQDKAGKYKDAIRSLKFYLLAAPDAPDAKAVKNLIYEIEYRQEKAAKESSPEAVAAREQRKFEDWLKKIDSRKYRDTRDENVSNCVLEVRGKFLVLICPRGLQGPWEIRGRVASTPRVIQSPPFPMQITYTFSEDGDRIIEHRDFNDGDVREFIWLWQR